MNGLFFRTTGCGAPVVFVHGWGVNSSVWQGQVEFFKNNFKVVTVDLQGHGASQPASQRLTISLCAKGLEELIKKNGFENAHLVGWSLGAQVIVRAAMTLGGKFVSSLVITGGTPSFLPPLGVKIREAERKKAKIFQRGISKDFEGTRSKFFQSCFNLKKWGREKRPDPIQAFFDGHGKFPIDKKSAIELLESLYEDNIQEEIRGVKFPSLICHGDQDEIIPVEAADLWQRALDNSRIEIFKNCGHAVFLEEPLSFNHILENFFLNCK